ncbi:MAG: type IX secretion system outer membrane channel protein PorV [bacterium]|nr:type IX secretion system outer membrane channel protein PorV [bacterium]
MTYLFKSLAVLTAFVFASSVANAQLVTGSDSTNRVITTAVPFLSFAPDSRGAAMGDLGVATSPDANSVHWNNGKLAFIEDDLGFSLSYVPWLGNIVDDMSVSYLTFYKKINRIQTIGVSFRYFDLGEIQLTDIQGLPQGIESPQELAFDGTYSRKLTENLGIGLTGRFIWSNLAGNVTGAPDAKAGTSVAVDLGVYYTKDLIFSGKNSNISAGAHISNIGQKITYTNEANEDFIPGNLRIGTAFKTNLDPYNSITLGIDANKLLVPSPPVYDADGNVIRGVDPNTRSLLGGTFGSFGDAPDGFSEEMKEITLSFGAEYWYRDIFSGRIGYFWESEDKGDRKFLTIGLGFRYQVFGVDFSYLIPPEQNDPLGDTLRVSLLFNMNKPEVDVNGN